MNTRHTIAARRIAILALVGTGCQHRPPPPGLRPLASVEPAPPNTPYLEPSEMCLATRAPAGFARFDGKEGKPYVRPSHMGAGYITWLSLREKKDGEPNGIKLCYVKDTTDCVTIAEAKKTSYADVCCELMGLGENASGPRIERVTFPEPCAGVLACCYEGNGSFGSGPGRPLRVTGRAYIAPCFVLTAPWA